jgi:hypothetical protein
MSKREKIFILILSITLIFGVFFFFPHTKKEDESGVVIPAHKTTQTTLEINGEKYESIITKRESVYDFMSDFKKKGVINFTDKNYIGMGELIISINGIKGNGEKDWFYYVNGKEAEVGVSNKIINPGDVVSWKYEKVHY